MHAYVLTHTSHQHIQSAHHITPPHPLSTLPLLPPTLTTSTPTSIILLPRAESLYLNPLSQPTLTTPTSPTSLTTPTSPTSLTTSTSPSLSRYPYLTHLSHYPYLTLSLSLLYPLSFFQERSLSISTPSSSGTSDWTESLPTSTTSASPAAGD